MKLKFVLYRSVCALLVAMAACSKDSPTRPTSVGSSADTATITDAVSGITLTTPQLNTPNDGQSFKFIEQPVTVSIKNAVSTGSTPLTYTFEVATDAAFAS